MGLTMHERGKASMARVRDRGSTRGAGECALTLHWNSSSGLNGAGACH